MILVYFATFLASVYAQTTTQSASNSEGSNSNGALFTGLLVVGLLCLILCGLIVFWGARYQRRRTVKTERRRARTISTVTPPREMEDLPTLPANDIVVDVQLARIQIPTKSSSGKSSGNSLMHTPSLPPDKSEKRWPGMAPKMAKQVTGQTDDTHLPSIPASTVVNERLVSQRSSEKQSTKPPLIKQGSIESDLPSIPSSGSSEPSINRRFERNWKLENKHSGASEGVQSWRRLSPVSVVNPQQGRFAISDYPESDQFCAETPGWGSERSDIQSVRSSERSDLYGPNDYIHDVKFRHLMKKAVKTKGGPPSTTSSIKDLYLDSDIYPESIRSEELYGPDLSNPPPANT